MRSASSDHDIPLAPVERRSRLRRVVGLGVVPLFAVPLLVLSADRLAPVDHRAPVGVRSVDGRASHAAASASGGDELAVAPPTSGPPSTTSVPPVTSVPAGPAVRSVAKPTTSTTVAPPAPAMAPTTATPPTTAAPPVTAPALAAPVPAAAPAIVAPPTTVPTTPPPTTAAPAPVNTQSGQATWYRWKAGNCAHNSLPFGTRVTVRAVGSGRTATCVVGDRGAFRSPTIIDLDATVFAQIAPLGSGRIAVTVTW